MKSKIEKIERIIVTEEGIVTAEVLAKVLNDIVGKQGEIIDHLNSQDQEEYEKRIRIKGELSGETEHIKAHKEYLATSKQDTPEEWGEKLWELIDEYRDSQDIASELEATEEVNQFVKQLLEEREDKAREEGKDDVDTFMEFLRGHSLVKDVHFYRGDGEREIIIKLTTK